MPNLGSVLKDEISRLAKRALRADVEAVRKSNAQHRRHIAAMKRQLADLERQVASLSRRAAAGAATAQPAASRRPVRFVAKGLRSQRARLGLSAAAFGKLAGVSAQTVYNWEREAAHPGREQLARLVALRGLGKREATRRLESLDT
ncbi:MAG: hypothetical protein BroJett026_04860 [Betaproteobacteria bacterium]|nr:MAG: hypothetical protein BroJett026_04860 [Betaproteobacteria bacterium]